MWCCVTLTAIGVLLTLDGAESQAGDPEFPTNSSCECGIPGYGANNRVIGGMVSTPHKYPWVVEILRRGTYHCGGSLINDRYVLTAAHCLDEASAQDISVALGAYQVSDPNDGIQVEVDELIVHEDYGSRGIRFNNDIALIKLRNPVQYSATIGTICLPSLSTDYTNQEATVVGWGATSQGGRPTDVLREGKVTVLSWTTCLSGALHGQITASSLCTYNPTTDSCWGDSGSPLMVERPNGRYEQIGVVSWGFTCERVGLPTVYTRTQWMLYWIHDHTTDAIYCENF